MFGLGVAELAFFLPILAVLALIVAVPTAIIVILVTRKKRGSNG
jgi:hypothetical protein